MVASTATFLAAGRFGVAPTVKRGTDAGLRLSDRPNAAGLLTNDPSGAWRALSVHARLRVHVAAPGQQLQRRRRWWPQWPQQQQAAVAAAGDAAGCTWQQQRRQRQQQQESASLVFNCGRQSTAAEPARDGYSCCSRHHSSALRTDSLDA